MNEISDWERGSDCHGQWKRRSADGDDVYVNDNAERGVFRSLVRGTLLGSTFPCPDAAREAADAHLVSQGRLPAERAFVRLTDWTQVVPGAAWHRVALHDGAAQVAQVDYGWGISTRRDANGSMGPETGDAGKAAADAELVRRGLLAEERAFRVAPSGSVDGVDGGTYASYARVAPAPGACEVSHDDGVTWEPAQAGVTLGPKSRLRYKAQTSSPAVKAWVMPVVPNAHEALPRDYAHEVIHKDAEPITLATWEHHLPTLLDNAPREFRDGFNRRQGPAWEAYLRGLAGVKEQMQCKRRQKQCSVRVAVGDATAFAHALLGPEWVKANVK